MTMNVELVRCLRARAINYHANRQKWQAIAYNKVADRIEALHYRIQHIHQVENMPGVGPSIRHTIEEFLTA